MRRVTGLTVFVLTTFLLHTQETEPQDPGIKLPPVLLEIADLQVEEVNAALPADEDQLRPEIAIPLPEAEEIFIPDYVFDIPYPEQLGVSPDIEIVEVDQYIKQTRSPIFSDGRIGVGAPVYVLGDLSLYKLGDEPRFRLRFFHEKLDGYGFREAGSGFYHSDDVLEGFLSYEREATGFEVSAGIRETSNGLQRGIAGATVEYDSASHRDVFTSASISHQLVPMLNVAGTLEVGYGSQILSAESPVISSEIIVSPRIFLGADLNPLMLSVEGDYEFASTPGASLTSTAHRLEAIINASYLLLPSDIRLSIDAGISWSSNDELRPNVVVGGEGTFGTDIRFHTEGGYRVRTNTYRNLWLDSPLLAQSGTGPLTPEFGWMWNGTIQIRPIPNLLITTDIDFAWAEGGVPNPSATPDATTGLFPFDAGSLISLDTDLAVKWEISQVFGADFLWHGAFIFTNYTRYEPVQTFHIAFDAEDPAERFGAALSTEIELDPAITIPIVGFGGYYRISESVQFQLDVRDVLAPLLDPGRHGWEPYIRPGLHAMLMTKISL